MFVVKLRHARFQRAHLR